MADFGGTQLHTADYRSPDAFVGQSVVVVGGGNSGAQIAADLLATATRVTWVTQRPPRYLPDDVDGGALFEAATRHVRARNTGEATEGISALGDIVAVPAVRHARDHRNLRAEPTFARLTRDGVRWTDGSTLDADTIIWCTGFRAALRHLRHLHLARAEGHPATAPGDATRARHDPRIRFLGYGDWWGPASATLIGVTAPARLAVQGTLAHLEPRTVASSRLC